MTVTQQIFDALCERPYGMVTRELVDVVYGNCEDGGPEDAHECVRLAILRFNTKQRCTGSRLRIYNSSYHGSGAGLRYQIWII